MVLPAALHADLFAFFDSVGLDPALTADAADDVQQTLSDAVPACLGFQLDLVDHGLAVTLTSFQPLVKAVDVVTSLHIPLLLLGLLRFPPTVSDTRPTRFDPGSSLTLFGARSGAFVDLAADFGHALKSARERLPGQDHAHRHSPPDAVTLDRHLIPSSMTSGFAGTEDLATINRAVGYLIEQGHDAAAALAELGRRAAAAEVTVLVYAAQLLGR